VDFKYDTAVDRRMKIWGKLHFGLQTIFELKKDMR